MRKLLFVLLVVVAVGCEKKEPTCVTCYVDGVEAVSMCIEDWPTYTAQELRESIDPLLENEECHYHN